jgi:solute carrier family 25 protein 42
MARIRDELLTDISSKPFWLHDPVMYHALQASLLVSTVDQHQLQMLAPLLPALSILYSQAQEQNSKANLSSIELMLCGAAAGAVAKTILAPIDRIKLLYFVSPTRKLTFAAALKTCRTIMSNTGFLGLFKGNASAMWRVLPYSAITFTCFQRYQELLASLANSSGVSSPFSSHAITFCSGSLAGITATIATHPLDLVRARAGAYWALQPLYPTAFTGMRRIYSAEGIRGLYAGLAPSVVGIIPYAGISFYLFDQFKKFFADLTHVPVEQLNPLQALIAGGGASALASAAVHPLQVVRRRMQVFGVAADTPKYRHTWGALTDVYKREGLRHGLYKGLLVTWMKTPLATAISLALNDSFTRGLHAGKTEVMHAKTLGEGDELTPLQQVRIFLFGPPDEHSFPDSGEAKSPSTPARAHGGGAPAPRFSSLTLLAIGATAGCVAKTAIAPADNIKILFQVNSSRHFTLPNAARAGVDIVKNHGVTALWRGNSATLMRVAPYSAITYTTFERYMEVVTKLLDVPNPMLSAEDHARHSIWTKPALAKFISGGLAGSTATAITYPLDLMRTRMAASIWDPASKYQSYAQGFFEISRKEGLRSLWSGLTPTLLGIFPYAGLSFTIYHTLKELYVRNFLASVDGEPFTLRNPPVLAQMGCGALAAVLSQTVCYPLDIVRRRKQAGQLKGLGVVACFKSIWKQEGMRGFFRSLSMNWVKGPVAAGISFLANDRLKASVAMYSQNKRSL